MAETRQPVEDKQAYTLLHRSRLIDDANCPKCQYAPMLDYFNFCPMCRYVVRKA